MFDVSCLNSIWNLVVAKNYFKCVIGKEVWTQALKICSFNYFDICVMKNTLGLKKELVAAGNVPPPEKIFILVAEFRKCNFLVRTQRIGKRCYYKWSLVYEHMPVLQACFEVLHLENSTISRIVTRSVLKSKPKLCCCGRHPVILCRGSKRNWRRIWIQKESSVTVIACNSVKSNWYCIASIVVEHRSVVKRGSYCKFKHSLVSAFVLDLSWTWKLITYTEIKLN